MNKFENFTDEELKVIKSALYRTIEAYERGDIVNEEEYKIASSMYSPVCLIIRRHKYQKKIHKSMSGAEIKQEIQRAGLKVWQVANAYGVNDSNFSRLLRKDFTEEQTEKIFSIINELKGERK